MPNRLPPLNAFYLVCRDEQLGNGRISQFHQWVLNTIAVEEDDINDGELG